MVHGDDFVAVGDKRSLAKLRATLESKFKLKVQTLGNGEGHVSELRVLNKVIRLENGGIELEADPRHAEIVIKELGLEGAKASKVPGVKGGKTDEEVNKETQETTEDSQDDESGELGPEEARAYRAIAARLNDLAADRVDIQFAVKEAA